MDIPIDVVDNFINYWVNEITKCIYFWFVLIYLIEIGHRKLDMYVKRAESIIIIYCNYLQLNDSVIYNKIIDGFKLRSEHDFKQNIYQRNIIAFGNTTRLKKYREKPPLIEKR